MMAGKLLFYLARVATEERGKMVKRASTVNLDVLLGAGAVAGGPGKR